MAHFLFDTSVLSWRRLDFCTIALFSRTSAKAVPQLSCHILLNIGKGLPVSTSSFHFSPVTLEEMELFLGFRKIFVHTLIFLGTYPTIFSLFIKVPALLSFGFSGS